MATDREQFSEAKPLKAPFPAFGGKSRVAAEVWQRFGDVRNYVEPFAFSCAVLLNRPGGAGPIETVNDLNSYVANFWRAVQHDPAAVALHADYPVIEDDLHARHRWLVTSDEAQHKLARVRQDPEFFDAKIAGWWCWGACCWIGTGWCDETHRNASSESRPVLRDGSWQGVTSRGLSEQLPQIGAAFGAGCVPEASTAGWRKTLSEQLPQMDAVGRLVLSPPDDTHRPQLADAFARGRGVNSNDDASTRGRRRAWLNDWMNRLADRLRPVRVCCGHWARVCDSDSTLIRLGLTGVFLDPPYRKTLACGRVNRSAHIYANDKAQDVNALCDEVQAWCLKWGANPEIRIALCGYEGEYPEIEAAGWRTHAWKSNGGYGNRTAEGKENAARERIWFSPACISEVPANQLEMFAA